MTEHSQRALDGGQATRSRRLRRAELLRERERAAARRRRRGYGLRLPVSQPLILPDSARPRLS